jgi:tRNA dimethylallyltransferase
MDIGTAKPTKKEIQGIPHHLLDIKNPNQSYTVAEFKKAAIKKIKEIQKRGKLPILCGGTGLYIKAVVDNLDIPEVKANIALREKIEKEIQRNGLNFVFNKLVKLDPEAAYIVDPKNPRRIIRALEITLLTKKPFSEQRNAGKPLFDVLEIGITLSKEKLVEKINLRVNQMIKRGLVNEVKKLFNKYGSQQAFDAIGYREIIEYLENKTSLQGAFEKIKINTWHFAKRQLTWFKPDRRIVWIKKYSQAIQAVSKFLKK